MTLDNLARIGRLKVHVATRDEIADLLTAARRNLEDAHAENISAENRLIQSLPKTIGIDAQRVVVLDVPRNKRNLSDYTGKPVDHGSLASCMAEAERLLDDTSVWLAACHPQLKP